MSYREFAFCDIVTVYIGVLGANAGLFLGESVSLIFMNPTQAFTIFLIPKLDRAKCFDFYSPLYKFFCSVC